MYKHTALGHYRHGAYGISECYSAHKVLPVRGVTYIQLNLLAIDFESKTKLQ